MSNSVLLFQSFLGYYKNQIEFLTALHLYQKNNNLLLLAQNTIQRLNEKRTKLGTLFLKELKLLADLKLRSYNEYESAKLKAQKEIHFFEHCLFCSYHKQQRFPTMSFSEVKFYCEGTERIVRSKVLYKELCYKQISDQHEEFCRYLDVLLTLGVVCHLN